MRRSSLILAAALAATAGSQRPARCSTLYWDADGSTTDNNTATGANLGKTGSWDSSAKWFDGVTEVPWVPDSDAVFTGTAGSVTLAGPQSAGSLAFKSDGYNVTAQTLTMTPATANFTVYAGVTATLASTLAGSSTMAKLGPGTLVLNNSANANTATTAGGGWRIEGGGILRIADDGSLGAPLPDSARNTVTDIQLNQSTIQFAAPTEININRRTKVNTNSSSNLGDAVIDVNQNIVSWFGSIQGGAGSLRVTDANDNGGMLILGTDKKASINPFGSTLPGGAVNLTVENRVVVQTSGQVTPTGGELGSETGAGGAVLAILLQNGGQIRSESGGYTFQRNLILGPGGGSLDTGAWIQTFAGGTVSGPGSLSKFGGSNLVLDNPSATWAGGTFIHNGTLQLGQGGSNGLLPGVLGSPSNVVIDSGATLKFLRGSNKSFFDNISGPGNVLLAGTATVRLVSDCTYTGLTTISSGTLMIGQGNPNQPGSIVSNVLDNATLVFNKVEDLIYAGSISGSGVVTKQAAGKLLLTGNHTYTGATNVIAGKLVVNDSLANTSVFVSGGASLAGPGSIAGTVTLAGGSSAAAQGSIDLRDNSIATLSLTDAIALDIALNIGGGSAGNPSLLDFDVGATADLIQLNSAKFVVNPGGGIITINPLSGFGPGTYDLLRFAAGQASGLNNLTVSTSNLPSNFTYQLQSTATAEQLVVTPEPSGCAALLGLGFLFSRRRKRPHTIAHR